MDPKQLPPPTESKAGLYTAINLFFNILTPIVVLLRLFCRHKGRISIGMDDWLIIAAQFLVLCIFGTTLHELGKYNGRHIYYVDQAGLPTFFKEYFFGEVSYQWIIGLVKMSTLAFYWRIFSLASRVPILTVAGILGAHTIAIFLVILFQCKPIAAAWDPMIPDKVCLGLNQIFLGAAVPNIITDAMIVILPIPYILRLQMRRVNQLALICVFLLGGFVTAVSIVRVVLFMQTDLNDPDFTWNTFGVTIWTTVEMNTAIICACLPMLKPLLNFVRTGKLFPSEETSTESEEKASGTYGRIRDRFTPSRFMSKFQTMPRGSTIDVSAIRQCGSSTQGSTQEEEGVEMVERQEKSFKKGVIEVRKDWNVEVESR